MNKHTPGPWIRSYHGFQILTINREASICQLSGDKPRDEQIANADLIANAPEMLEALQMAYRKHHLDDPSIGWDELSDRLGDVLSNVMSPEAFAQWLQEFNS